MEARTALPLCGSTVSPVSSTAPAPGGVGDADHGARVARVGDPDEHGDQRRARGQRAVERHVEQVADGDQALRGDRLGQARRGAVGHREIRAPRARRGLDEVGVARQRVGGDEQLVDRPAAQGLPDGLRPLHEEPPGPFAPRAAQQLACCRPRAGCARCRAVSASVPCRGDRAQAASCSAAWAGTFAFATSTSAANAAGSLTASSARILRSTSTPAALRPWMNRL